MKNQRRSPIEFLLPRLGDILFLAVFACVILLGPRLLNVDGDLGRHLAVGNWILDTHQIPVVDIFSHTMGGQPLTPHEWLSEVVYALFYRWMGLNGVVLLCGFLLAATFTILYRVLLKQWERPLLCLGLCLAAFIVSSLHWLARPHLFTFLFLTLWLSELERLWRGETSRWWIFGVLMLFWANSHGAFIVGFVTWGIYLAGRIWDRWTNQGQNQSWNWSYWLGAGGISLAASFINPSGWHLWSTSLGFLQNRYLVGHTAEYLSPDFHQFSTWPFLVLLIGSIVVIGLRKQKITTAHVLLLAAWAGMGLISLRNIPLFAICATFVLAEALSGETIPQSGIEQRFYVMEKRLSGWTWPVVLVVLVILGFGKGMRLDAQQKGNQFDGQVFPVAAVDWLEKNPQTGPVYNYFPWGGYLLYREWPKTRVFIDGQTDFYGEPLTRQYETIITTSPGWQSILKDYRVQWVLIPGDTDLARVLAQSADWSMIYQDKTAVIYVHQN
jgi:hypothetical protein